MSKRKTITVVVCAMLALVLVSGIIAYATSNSRRICNVYAVSDIAMTDYWADDNTTYGQVRSDKVQTIYLSGTQQVTEVYVTEGQHVQAGDKLLAYDTTLSALEVSRQELELQQMREELSAAKKKYNTLAGSKVYSVDSQITHSTTAIRFVPQTEQEPTYRLTFLANPGEEIDEDQTPDYLNCGGKGTSEEPYLYLCSNGIPFGTDFLREIEVLPQEGEEESDETEKSVYVVFGISEDNKEDGKILQAGGMCFTLKKGNVSFIVFDASDYIGHPFNTEKPAEDCDHSFQATVTNPTCTTDGFITYTCTKCDYSYKDSNPIPALGHSYKDGKCTRCNAADPNYKPNNSNNNNNNNTPNSNNNTKPNNNNSKPNSNNNTKPNSNTNTNNNTKPNSNTNTNNNTKPNSNTNPGPSYAEIQAQKAELQQKIKELDLDIRMAEVELKRMKQELSDGIVYAEMDGTISSVLDSETARQTAEPLVKLSGGGGYYLEGSISELELDKVFIGQKVTVHSWESGETYDGTVQSISDTPTENGGYYGSGNMNVSYYPFIVAIDGTANFREYESVDIQLDIEQEISDAFYLEQPFIRQENGQNYVFISDENGILRKKNISTGITLWGSTVQILDGLSLDDCIAFPYGKNAMDGAKTQLSTLDELYGW